MEGQRRILDLCVDAGETLLANGAEIYRVQQTMEIIARSYGARSFHVYVLTNGLFASMEDGGAVQSACRWRKPLRGLHRSAPHVGCRAG